MTEQPDWGGYWTAAGEQMLAGIQDAFSTERVSPTVGGPDVESHLELARGQS